MESDDPNRWARQFGPPREVALIQRDDGRWNVGIRVERGWIDGRTEPVGVLDGSPQRYGEVVVAAEGVLQSFLDALDAKYTVVWAQPAVDRLSGQTGITGRFELDV